MMHRMEDPPHVAIACGGTGGHLFPGLAVAEQLTRRECKVTLLISPKAVDQQAVKNVSGMEIVTLPAVALQNRNFFKFFSGCVRSYRHARQFFKRRPPQAILAMGGFTSAPPIFAARRLGARAFIHESNTIPGRANRWLSPFVDTAFLGFPQAAARLRTRNSVVTGTPVRPQFYPRDAAKCRAVLGLDLVRPVVLVMGGSQGASGINKLIKAALPLFAQRTPDCQWFHLSGANDVEQVKQAYAVSKLKAMVHPFFAEMELALGAATVAVSRAGASSLAELAAMRLPAVLVPYPAAADNHQFFNAEAFVETGAARLLEEKTATPESLTQLVSILVENAGARESMRVALGQWHQPRAAETIAETMLKAIKCNCHEQSSEKGVTPPSTLCRRSSIAA